jgi:hypothetical protein
LFQTLAPDGQVIENENFKIELHEPFTTWRTKTGPGREYLFSLHDTIQALPEYMVDLACMQTWGEEYGLVLEHQATFPELFAMFETTYAATQRAMQASAPTNEVDQVTVDLYQYVILRKKAKGIAAADSGISA